MFKNRNILNKAAALLLLFTWFLVLAPSTMAQTKTFNWTNWDIDIVLQPDGSLVVTETQTLDFQGAPYIWFSQYSRRSAG